MALAALDDSRAAHPPLEALFTVDEETDMKGAKGVTADMLLGETLINLDAETLGIAYVSSAAGVGANLEIPVRRVGDSGGMPYFRAIRVEGLLGGHSGVEIQKVRANAYVLSARFLNAVRRKIDFTLHVFE